MSERDREYIDEETEMRAREAEFHPRESTRGKSPEELENDIDAIRRDMDVTLDELERSFSPGQMVDRAIGYIKENPGEYFSNLGNTVRNNPVPTTLVGIGLSWLAVTANRSPSYERQGHSLAERAKEKKSFFSGKMSEKKSELNEKKRQAKAQKHQKSQALREKLHQKTDAVQEKVHQAGEKFHEAGDRAREMREAGGDRMHAMRDRAQQVREASGERMHAMGERAHHMRESAGEWSHRVSEAGHRSSDRVRKMRSSASSMIHEQPLLLGFFGIAVGTLLGAMLPKTREEERLLGDTGERLRHRAVEEGREVAQEAVERAEDVAHTAVHKTEEEISRRLH